MADQAQSFPTLVNPLLKGDKHAAQSLGIGRSLFRKLNSSGLIPRPVRIGRRVLWRTQELEDWVRMGCPPRAQWEAQKGASK